MYDEYVMNVEIYGVSFFIDMSKIIDKRDKIVGFQLPGKKIIINILKESGEKRDDFVVEIKGLVELIVDVQETLETINESLVVKIESVGIIGDSLVELLGECG